MLKVAKKFIIIATGRYIGEGFDFPPLDTLFLTLPISWKGTLQQYVGRIVRSHESKSSIEVYDYLDLNFERFTKMYDNRRKAYRNLGFKIIKDWERKEYTPDIDFS
ncbi:DEAD/DEAH box helicase [bacterium]|nr:DEAD/DEAH box helicase [bacterium]